MRYTRLKSSLDAFIIRLGKGERPGRELAGMFDEVDIPSMHMYTLPPDKPAGLHYHEHDEYWLFIEGTTTVSLRLEDGTTKQFLVEPGDLVATPKGVEHGHAPQTVTRYVQFTSKIRSGARLGHLERAQ